MTRMLVGSCADFHNKVWGFITKATPAALHIETQATAYERAIAKLSSVVNRQKAFVVTLDLKRADDLRDKACGTICAVVNAFLNSPVKEKREAAELLDPQLSSYRGIRNHKYTKQTAEVKGMYGVLTAEKNAPAVTLLGLDPETGILLEANEEFERLFLEKAAEANEKAKVSDLDSELLMKEANALYNEIVEIVNAYAIVQSSDEINTFIENVNGLVKVYADEAGSSTGESGKPSEETPEEGGGEEEGGENQGQPSIDEGDGEDDRPAVQ